MNEETKQEARKTKRIRLVIEFDVYPDMLLEDTGTESIQEAVRLTKQNCTAAALNELAEKGILANDPSSNAWHSV